MSPVHVPDRMSSIRRVYTFVSERMLRVDRRSTLGRAYTYVVQSARIISWNGWELIIGVMLALIIFTAIIYYQVNFRQPYSNETSPLFGEQME